MIDLKSIQIFAFSTNDEKKEKHIPEIVSETYADYSK